MAAAEPTAATLANFSRATQRYDFDEQGQFFLNAYWGEHGSEAETIYECAQSMKKVADEVRTKSVAKADQNKKLDEAQSHRFLEVMGQTLTVIAMREELRKIDVDSDNCMSLLEYLLYRYNHDVEDLMSRPQGASEEVERAAAIVKEIGDTIKKIKSKRSKWEGKPVPESGPKKIAYDNDQMVLNNWESDLVQKMDLAQRKLAAAQRNPDLRAQGKFWWVEKDLEIARRYAPPKKNLRSL